MTDVASLIADHSKRFGRRMTKTVIHIDWSTAHDLEILHLGQHEVGRISATGGKSDRPRYLFMLGRHGCFWKTVRTVEDARKALLDELDEWLRKAKLA